MTTKTGPIHVAVDDDLSALAERFAASLAALAEKARFGTEVEALEAATALSRIVGEMVGEIIVLRAEVATLKATKR